jgi:tyrosine-protein phosphatase SIW14
MRRFSSCVVPFLLLATSTFGQQPPSSALSPSTTTRSAYGDRLKLIGLRNGGRINEHLYRGAQPRAEALPELKKLGITTIVDLRGEDPNKRDWERHQAESLGIRFVNIPVSGWAPPSNEQVAQFLSLFRNDPNERIFVHCRFGDDRTGVFVATYRMAYNGWSAQQAMNEMYYFGFNGIWHPSMKTFIREFPGRLKTVPVLTSYRPVEETVTKCNNPSPTSGCSN